MTKQLSTDGTANANSAAGLLTNNYHAKNSSTSSDSEQLVNDDIDSRFVPTIVSPTSNSLTTSSLFFFNGHFKMSSNKSTHKISNSSHLVGEDSPVSPPSSTTTNSFSSNDANGRSAALEHAYVHDIYENCEEPTGTLRPRVVQFLNNLEPGAVVCDVGCGNGRYLTQSNPTILSVGVDRCYRLSCLAKSKGAEVTLCDNLELPFRNECFDAVLSLAVIHHFATTERRVNALRELARILRIGGRVIITVWAFEQKHRRFESQDVLIPWQPSQSSSTQTGSDEEDDEEYLPPYHAYVEDSNSSRSGGEGDSSSLSSSSPGESCYSFVRRAIQKLAGGRRHAWFLDSWISKDSPKENSLDIDDVRDLPIELRRLENLEVFCDPPLAAGVKSQSLSNIMNSPPCQIVRSRSSVPSLNMPNNLPTDKLLKSTNKTYAAVASLGKVQSTGVTTTLAVSGSSANSVLNTNMVTTASHSTRPKLIKQKQSLCDESFQLSDVPFQMLKVQNNNPDGQKVTETFSNSQSISNSFSLVQTMNDTCRDYKQMRKQSSLNEELMAGNRILEKERVKKRIQKQRSLNEAFLCRSSIFTKRLQVIREGFSKKVKNSTENLERATKSGFNRMIQNLKNSTEEKQSTVEVTNINKNEQIKDTTLQGCAHNLYHHHHHHYHPFHQHHTGQQTPLATPSISNQTQFPLVSNFQSQLQHFLHRPVSNAFGIGTNTNNRFAGPVTICRNVECASTACYCTAYQLDCPQCIGEDFSENKARRHSRESGSDSSKDNSLQSDTSIESEDSFASVIYTPKPDSQQQLQQQQNQQLLQPLFTQQQSQLQLNYQKQHQNSTSSSSNSSSSNGSSSCHVHQKCSQNKCSTAFIHGRCCKTEHIRSLPTSPLILPCPPTPAHSPATAQVETSSPPETVAVVTAAMSMLQSTIQTDTIEEEIALKKDKQPSLLSPVNNNISKNTLNSTYFNFETHDQVEKPKIDIDIAVLENVSNKENSLKTLHENNIDRTPNTINDVTEVVEGVINRITRQTIRNMPPIPKFRRQHSIQLSRQAFPIVRRSSPLTGATISSLPKLMSLELFNPATDDLDSDSSEASSPESVDSVISAPKSQTILNQINLNDSNEEKNNNLEQSEKKISNYNKETITLPDKKDNRIIVNNDNSTIFPIKHDSKIIRNGIKQEPIECLSFVEQLNTKLIQKLDKTGNTINGNHLAKDHLMSLGYINETKTNSGRIIENLRDYIDDPILNYRSRDRSAIRDELRERRLMLANLPTQPSLNQSPTSSTPSSRSYTIHEEDEEEEEEEAQETQPSLTFNGNQSAEEKNISNNSLNIQPLKRDSESTSESTLTLYEQYKRTNIYENKENAFGVQKLHPEMTCLLQDVDDSVVEDDVEEEQDLTDEGNVMCQNEAEMRSENVNRKQNEFSHKTIMDSKDIAKIQSPSNCNSKKWNKNSNNSNGSLESPTQGGATTHHRYYHVFREGELDALINHHVASLHIVSSYYERASWCVVAEKVQVWTI